MPSSESSPPEPVRCVFLFISLQLEGLFVILVSIMTVAFFVDLGISPPSAKDLVGGFSFTAEPYATVPALGLIGAVIMPHNIYLHSALVLSRLVDRSNTKKLWEVRFRGGGYFPLVGLSGKVGGEGVRIMDSSMKTVTLVRKHKRGIRDKDRTAQSFYRIFVITRHGQSLRFAVNVLWSPKVGDICVARVILGVALCFKLCDTHISPTIMSPRTFPRNTGIWQQLSRLIATGCCHVDAGVAHCRLSDSLSLLLERDADSVSKLTIATPHSMRK